MKKRPSAGNVRPRGYRQMLPSLLSTIENSLTVADVAERGLKYVPRSWPARRCLEWLNEQGFDVAPVREKPPRRYVFKEDLSDVRGPVDKWARPIDASHLATASLGLPDGILLLGQSRFFFVIEGTTLLGIVTLADLQRPAVGMATLSLILAAEAGMNPLIVQRFGEAWPEKLSRERREKAEEVLKARKRHDVDISLLQCIMLEDRINLLRHLDHVLKAIGFGSKREFDVWTKRLKALRNVLAHGDDLLDVESDPHEAIKLFAEVKGFAESIWRLAGNSGVRA